MAYVSLHLFVLVLMGSPMSTGALRAAFEETEETDLHNEKSGERLNCHQWVPGSISRNCRNRLFGACGWFSDKKCKCPAYSEMAGEDPACQAIKEAKERKFKVDDLKNKGCSCKRTKYLDYPNFVPLKQMEPHFNCRRETSSIREFVEDARKWCKSDYVPENIRVPEKMRGLYWLKDLNLQNFAFCTSLAEWNKTTLVMELAVWTHFMFYEGPTTSFDGMQVAKMAYDDAFFKLKIDQGPMLYKMAFNSTDMSWAEITPNSWIFSGAMDFTLVELQKTPDDKVQSVKPGDIYDRPCYLIAKKKFLDVMHYEAVRVLYDDGTINEANLKLMEEMEDDLFKKSNSKIVRYSQTCEKWPAEI